MYKFILILFAVTLFACTDQQTRLLEKIKDIEQSDKIGTEEGLDELAALHAKYGVKYDDETANGYLYAAGQYYYYDSNYSKSKDLLYRYISRDDSSKEFKNAAWNLALIEAQNQEYDKAEELVAEVLDKQVPSMKQWRYLIEAYATNQNLSQTAHEQLLSAHIATMQFEPAIDQLELILQKFPDAKNRADLLYRGGFIGWEYMNNKDVAEKYYNQLLEEYPNYEKAEEVKGILNSGMLSMSNAEILEMLKQKAQQNEPQ
jgi:tetratricopeptide (TPR) repeat protein